MAPMEDYEKKFHGEESDFLSIGVNAVMAIKLF
jgi:hypothetical protein